jgi:hypothetical protein
VYHPAHRLFGTAKDGPPCHRGCVRAVRNYRSYAQDSTTVLRSTFCARLQRQPDSSSSVGLSRVGTRGLVALGRFTALEPCCGRRLLLLFLFGSRISNDCGQGNLRLFRLLSSHPRLDGRAGRHCRGYPRDVRAGCGSGDCSTLAGTTAGPSPGLSRRKHSLFGRARVVPRFSRAHRRTLSTSRWDIASRRSRDAVISTPQ